MEEVVKPISKKVIGFAGGGLVGLATLLTTYIDSKIEASNQLVEEKYKNVKDYVDSKHEVVETKLSNIEHLLIRIDDRVYLLTSKKGE